MFRQHSSHPRHLLTISHGDDRDHQTMITLRGVKTGERKVLVSLEAVVVHPWLKHHLHHHHHHGIISGQTLLSCCDAWSGQQWQDHASLQTQTQHVHSSNKNYWIQL